jgi:hypothetical protein
MILLASFTALGAACSQKTAGSAGAPPERVVGAPIPPSSSLAKVQLGMTKPQVREILGQPNDENSYASGKVFIPFYFGNDARRTSWYYKGLGRVVFADGNAFGGGTSEVVRVDYDPGESGTAR